MKELCIEKTTNCASLQLRWANCASLDQRKGRAGRVASGFVWRIITRELYNLLDRYPTPEFQRCPLEQVVLKSKIFDMGEPVALLGNAISPPDVEDILLSCNKLKEVILFFILIEAQILCHSA